ncbi:hypothetical protein R5W24_005566 [Gemmata sp. JC717]|uniref:hypothetical protein n=1 Tax=Gemmata algarum TaxID=2975278 RepID=UPI0021BB7DFF|nr:hypothetical protein [Gemmata algarum]MDY3556401.1 hypothetical protein [Gemmata algarum]
MTEADWLACRQPAPMLDALGDLASPRKRRLFACACCRRLEAPLPHLWLRAALDVAERFADGHVSNDELRDAWRRVGEDLHTAHRRIEIETRSGPRPPKDVRASALLEAQYSALRELSTAVAVSISRSGLGQDAVRAVQSAAQTAALRTAIGDWQVRAAASDAGCAEELAQAELVRDLFTDRFWFVVPDPVWFTPDVLALANYIYNDHAFEQMPILADALQDAGCESGRVLDHCRGPGPHARGCWVVDLVLGKE